MRTLLRGWSSGERRFVGAVLEAATKRRPPASPNPGNRFLPVSSCCINAFFLRLAAAIRLRVCSIASSHVDSMPTVFFCSEYGGFEPPHLLQ